jgi:NAD(P)-dependent dehydrogenase (short-subunit alcohol dehydrogenase family)
MKLKGKTALITGANSGIGYSTCLLFAKEKCKIIAVDLADKITEDLKGKLKALNGQFDYFSVDVSNFESLTKLYQQLTEANITIDILVNNAGILGTKKKTEDYPVDIFEQVMKVNVNGVYYAMKVFLPAFVEKKAGLIINTSSVAGHVGMAGHIAYSASKHAVLGMTKTVALEYAKYGIRVNAVCPGFTQTAMLDTAEVDIAYKETLKMVTPMKRFGEASEIATAILFLATDQSSFMTGQSIILDGGLTSQ